MSNHPRWPLQAGCGLVMAVLVFAAAIRAQPRSVAAGDLPACMWTAIALNAVVAGTLVGWTIENVPVESFDVGGWLRNLSFAALAIAAPIAGAAAMARRTAPPAFATILMP